MKRDRLFYDCQSIWMRVCLRREGAHLRDEIRQPAPCELCGRPTWQVHHLFPKSQEFDLNILFEPRFGLVACQDCHSMYHHDGRRKEFWQLCAEKLAEKDPDRWDAIDALRGLVWRKSPPADLIAIRRDLRDAEESQLRDQWMDSY